MAACSSFADTRQSSRHSHNIVNNQNNKDNNDNTGFNKDHIKGNDHNDNTTNDNIIEITDGSNGTCNSNDRTPTNDTFET